MVSASALLQRWRHLLFPGTATPNVHPVTDWKIASLQHVSVASCCEPQHAKPMPAYMRAACPKRKGEGRRGGEYCKILHTPLQGTRSAALMLRNPYTGGEQYARKSSDLCESSCLAAEGSCQVVGGWRMCWERGNSERVFVLAKML